MQIMAVMCKNLEELMVRDFEVGGEHVWITGWKAGGLLKS